MEPQSGERRILTATLLIALPILSILHSLVIFPAIDFYVFWSAANADIAALYHSERFINPPSALLWIAPLKLLAFWPAFTLWTAASIAAFAVASPYPKHITALALVSPIAVVGLVVGQVSLLLSAAIFFAVRYRLGWLIGIILTIKPQIAFLAPLIFLLRADWRVLAEMLAGAALSGGASLILFGPDIWSDWLNAISVWRAEVATHGTFAYSASPTAYAQYWSIDPGAVWFASALLAAGAIFALARRLEGGALVALIVCASALAAPYALLYDLVGAAPLAVLIVTRRPTLATGPAYAGLTGFMAPLVLLFAAALACITHLRAVTNRGTKEPE